MAQFVIGIAGALMIAELYVQKGMQAVLIPCMLLWIQLFTLGLLNEGRASARRLEWLRLLVAVPALYWLLQATTDGLQLEGVGWIIVAVYLAVSATWLALIPSTERQLLIH